MKREYLKELGIADDIIDKIMAENGKDIEKHKGDAEAANTAKKTLEETNRTLEASVAERDKQLEELKKADPKELEAKITELQTANTTAKTEFETQLKQIKLDATLETRLIKEGAVNTKAVKALLDSGKITLDGDNIIGLDDQLAALKESEKWAFSAPPNTGKGGARQGTPPGAGGEETVGDEITSIMFGTTA